MAAKKAKAKAKKSPRPVKKAAAAQKKVVAKKPAAQKKVAKKAVKPTTVKKAVMKKSAKKSVARKVAPVRTPAAKPIASPNRPNWVDELTQTPLIDDYARQLESFISAMADGRVEEHEVSSQEKRVVALLREIDPQLDDALHAKVTQLLCELTAYAIMQMLYAMEQSRPKTVFQG
jgi:hypothetical protein